MESGTVEDTPYTKRRQLNGFVVNQGTCGQCQTLPIHVLLMKTTNSHHPKLQRLEEARSKVKRKMTVSVG